jgi:hypothetical protein
MAPLGAPVVPPLNSTTAVSPVTAARNGARDVLCHQFIRPPSPSLARCCALSFRKHIVFQPCSDYKPQLRGWTFLMFS